MEQVVCDLLVRGGGEEVLLILGGVAGVMERPRPLGRTDGVHRRREEEERARRKGGQHEARPHAGLLLPRGRQQ